MDLLRLFSMLAIVFYHMLITLCNFGARQAESVRIFYENANAHIATTGVGIFFMLSGAGLMLSTSKGDFHVLSFWKSRAVKILVPYYLVNLFYLFFQFLVLMKEGGDPGLLWPKSLSVPRAVLMILGVDTYAHFFLGAENYAKVLGDSTWMFSGIGEWFLGCLILMYLVFPLLRIAVKKKPHLTIVISTVYLAVMLFFYEKIFAFSAVAEFPYVNFFVKVYDFILGMYLATVSDKIPKWSAIPSAVVTVAFLISPIAFPLNYTVLILILNLSIYLIALAAEPLFEKIPRVMNGVSFLCRYSYYFFLIHHVVIIHTTINWIKRCNEKGIPLSNSYIPVIFAEEMLITALFSAGLAYLLSLPKKFKEKNKKKC